jgi:hypothetical protein
MIRAIFYQRVDSRNQINEFVTNEPKHATGKSVNFLKGVCIEEIYK